MSFSDQSPDKKGRMIGCLWLSLIIMLVVGVLLVGAALGDCPIADDGTGCENDGVKRFLMFPGSLILAIPIIVLLARWAMKDDLE